MLVVCALCIPLGFALAEDDDAADIEANLELHDDTEALWLNDDVYRSHNLRVRGGLSYFDVPTDAHVGGTYGIEGLLPWRTNAGGYAGIKVNQFSGGTQYLGTIGLYKMPDLAASAFTDRIGFTALFDQFTDSRGDDLYLSQIRAQVGYAAHENLAVGARLAEPLAQDSNRMFTVSGATSLTGFSAIPSVAAFASSYVGDKLLTGIAGHRRDVDAVYVGAALRVPKGDHLFTFADAFYDDRGSWFGTAGFEFRFGTASRSSHMHGFGRSPWDDLTIAESFNSGEAKFWGATQTPEPEPETAPPPPPIIIPPLSCCFLRGARIQMADGRLKNIEDVRVGDRVVSYDETTGQWVEKSVTRTISKDTVNDHADACRKLGFDACVFTVNDTGLYFTPEHPFLIREDGEVKWAALVPYPEQAPWKDGVAPVRLREGQEVLSRTGWVLIERIAPMHREGLADETVFNLTIEDTHTYVANGLLVHNK